MSNPLDNESRKLVVGGSPASSTVPIEPFPRIPDAIKGTNPFVRKAWDQTEMEIDRWRKQITSSMQAQQPESPDLEIKRLDDAILDLKKSLAMAGTVQNVSAVSIQKTINQILAQFGDFLERAGGTMIGSLILAHDPVQALEAVTKQYVLALISSINQYVHVQLTPDNPWLMTHGRTIIPGGVRLFKGSTMQEIHLVDRFDDVPGICRAVFGYNEAGIGVLTFS